MTKSNPLNTADGVLSPAATAAAEPWALLVREIAALLADTSVYVPPRIVQPLPGGASLFVMPAHDSRVAITKLISFTPANAMTAAVIRAACRGRRFHCGHGCSR